MKPKKYELTDEKLKLSNGRVLRRIRYLKNFGSIKNGDLGGWLERESNLSQSGNAAVSGDAQVSGDARVSA